MLKLFAITQKAVKISQLVRLVTDTVAYFHNEGVSRGIFGNGETPLKPIPDTLNVDDNVS